jgi:GDPmannose 4,6-dehydratase
MAKIKLGKLDVLELGNMDAKRDWGFAKEYVEGMWRMLQADKPDTYVLATNRTETVRDFVTLAAKAAGLRPGVRRVGRRGIRVDAQTGKTLVRVNPLPSPGRSRPADRRPGEKAKRELGWEPKTTLEQLCQMMVAADLQRNEAGNSF